MKILYTLSLILLFALPLCMNAQQPIGKEYFVTVNPSTGHFTKISYLKGIHWIATANLAFDKVNQVYFFKGDDSAGQWHLYSIDATNGTIKHMPLYPAASDPSDNVIEIRYDNNTQKLYGLHWDNSMNSEFLVWIDPATGNFTKINNIPKVSGIYVGTSEFDEKNHLYMFRGVENTGKAFLYTINVLTGQVVSNPLPKLMTNYDNVSATRFNNTDGKLYGLYWSNAQQREFLVTIDSGTSNINFIDSLPGVKFINTLPVFTTIDENKGLFIFRGANAKLEYSLYSVDISSGKIVNKVDFPKVCLPLDNVIQLQHDKASDKLYALHWENEYQKLRDTSICLGGSIGFQLIPADAKWSNGDSGTTITPLKTGYYSFRGTRPCDSSIVTDSLYITLWVNKTSLPDDTAFCNNQFMFLYETSNFPKYTWGGGKGVNYLRVTKPGKYIFHITDKYNCKFSDTVNVRINKPIKPKLGPDKSLCDFTGFFSLSEISGYAFNKYVWNQQDTGKVMPIKRDGVHILETTDSNRCKASDTIKILWKIMSPPTPNLGSDRYLCKGDSLVITPQNSANAGYTTYLWNTGDTSKSITVKDSGTYVLEVRNDVGCKASGSLNVILYPSYKPDLGTNRYICRGNYTSLFNQALYQIISYQWSNGSDKEAIYVFTEGTYTLTAVDNNGCKASSAPVKVIFYPLRKPQLGPDSVLCHGDSSTIMDHSKYKFYNYTWNTGEKTVSILGKAGKRYILKVNDYYTSCVAADTIRLNDVTFPPFDLGRDTTLCGGELLHIDIPLTGVSYVWNDGSASASRTISKAGTYSLKVSKNGCDTTDEIQIKAFPYPVVNLGTMTFCDNPKFELEAGEALSYRWSTGEQTRSIKANGNQLYWVEASNDRCSVRDTLKIIYLQNHPFYLPNAFSPNNDGHNDILVAPSDFEVISVRIYNRWGQQVYGSENIPLHWDGTFMGELCQQGAYMATVEYRDCAGNVKVSGQAFQLLR